MECNCKTVARPDFTQVVTGSELFCVTQFAVKLLLHMGTWQYWDPCFLVLVENQNCKLGLQKFKYCGFAMSKCDNLLDYQNNTNVN